MKPAAGWRECESVHAGTNAVESWEQQCGDFSISISRSVKETTAQLAAKDFGGFCGKHRGKRQLFSVRNKKKWKKAFNRGERHEDGVLKGSLHYGGNEKNCVERRAGTKNS